MKKQSLTEKDLFFQFIKQLNKDNFKDATKLLTRFINTNYYNEFQLLKKRVESIKVLESTKISSTTKIFSLERQIDNLNNKIIELKQKKLEKTDIKEDIMRKIQITNCLLQSNFDRAIQLAKKYKEVKMQHIAEQLQEYRWFKLQLGNTSLPSTSTKKDIELSTTGKIFKTILVNNKFYRSQINKYLNNALQSIVSKDRHLLKLPNQYFTDSCCDAIERFAVFIDSLRGIKALDEQYNLKKIICISQKIGFKKNQQNADFNQQFDDFLQYVVQHVKPINEDYGLTIKRVQSQSNEVQMNHSTIYAKLCENINKLIKNFDISSTDDLVVTQNLNSYMTLITLYKNILFKLKGFEDSIANHKEMISNKMTESSIIQMKLYQLNQKVQARIPTINNLRTSLLAYDDNVSLFEDNFLLFLNEFDKYKAASNNQQQEINNNRNAYNSQNEEEQNCLLKIEPRPSPVNEIERLTQQVQRLTSENHELVKNNQYLKETFEQQYKIKNMQKQVNQSLVSKIKILEGVQSCIMHTPYVDQHSDLIALQQRIKELSIENEKLKNVIQQRQMQIKQFKKYQTQAIIKMQQKEKQIKQWKQKHHKLRQELEELNEAQEKLHEILQEQEKYINQKKTPKKQKHLQTKIEQSKGQKQQTLKPVDKITISTQTSHFILTQSINSNQQRTNQQYISIQDNPDKNRIEQLQKVICSLRQQILQKQKQHLQIRSKDKKRFESIYSDLQNENKYLQVKLNEASIRSVVYNQQNIKNIHIFPPGFIFDQSDYRQRLFLIEHLISCVGPIKRTRLLYRADHYNKTNFHKYFDKHKHVVFIFKTISGKLIAGYSEEAFDPNGVKKGYGMILSLWAQKVFTIKEKKAIGYDDYFAIFGNSELRIKSLEFKLFSNFGIANGYYDNRGEKVHSILGQEKQREVDLSQYEIYALDLEA